MRPLVHYRETILGRRREGMVSWLETEVTVHVLKYTLPG